MISYIRGELAGLERDKAIVDVQGVGYGIYMPEQSLSLLGPIGCEVKIHTYLNVREDAMQLFGFLTRDDLEVFRLRETVFSSQPVRSIPVFPMIAYTNVWCSI